MLTAKNPHTSALDALPLDGRSRGLRALALALLLGAFAVSVALGPVTLRPAWSLGCLLGAGAAWALCVWTQRERAPATWLIWAVWAVLHAGALAWEPRSSDDIHRYIWEGGLVAEGRSPYAHTPESAELQAERERWSAVYAGVNNKDLSAIYPPLAQYVFAGVVAAAGGPAAREGASANRALRLAFTAADAAVLVALLALLRARRLPRGRAIVWAWSPLCALEFAGAGHLDVLGIAALMSALACGAAAPAASAERVGSAGAQPRAPGSLAALAWLAAGALTKLLPIVALPFLARAPSASARPSARLAQRMLFCAALLGAGFLPLVWLDGGLDAVGRGLGEYGLRWEAASLVYRWLEKPLLYLHERDRSWLDPRRLGRALALAIWAAIALREWLRGSDPLRATRVLLGAYLVLSPTLHPWYLSWVLPLLAFAPSPAWTYLFAVAPLCYWPLARWQSEGVWSEPVWLWPVVSLPFLALLAWQWFCARRALPVPSAAA